MAHHQGMTLLTLANFLHDGVVQRWFHNDRRVQATELLLHERPATNVKSLRKLYGAAA
jgi:cyclic beta-1,2-glucan synthetase